MSLISKFMRKEPEKRERNNTPPPFIKRKEIKRVRHIPHNESEPIKPKEQTLMGGIDLGLIVVVLLIIAFGLWAIFSSTGMIVGSAKFHNDEYWFLRRQIQFVFLGMLCAIFVANLPRKTIYKWVIPAFIALIASLTLVFSPLGISAKGAARWISLFGISFQPFEFLKIGFAMYLAAFLTSHQESIGSYKKIFVPLLFLIGMVLAPLLLLQPDYGGLIIICSIAFMMMMLAGARRLHIILTLSVLAPIAVFLAKQSPYRWRRIISFMNPEADPQGSGYQLTQSYYAIGSGGEFGVGLGVGAHKVNFLPEAHTDFILPVIAEEWGFFGICILMLLFCAFFYCCFKIVRKQYELQDKLSSCGISLVLCSGILTNIAVVIGLCPTKGVALPFISYGGSCMVASLICVGILLNFSRTPPRSTQ